jgi:hypothetical protein
MTPTFKNLSISGWRQFKNVALEFHPRLTVLTGSNGAGKSSLLNLLTPHFGWQRAFLGTPKKKRTGGEIRYFTGIRRRSASLPSEPNAALEVGRITYSNGAMGHIQAASEAQQYSVTIINQQSVLGTFISSHRVMPTFQPVNHVSPHMLKPDHAYGQFQAEYLQRYVNGHTGYSPVYRLKESLVAMALFGAKSDYSSGNEIAIAHLNGFIAVLRRILPPSLKFKDLSIRETEIVIETFTGNFVIDAASGGLVAIIDIAWQIYSYSLTNQAKDAETFTVVIDEPENHLHPSMQRMLLGNLLDAFPRAQFIVATHSPFMVSSVRDSSVYALRYEAAEPDNEELEVEEWASVTSHVFSERLDTVNRAGGAADILRDVLGVPVTVPEWVEEQLEQIVSEFRSREINQESLKELRSKLALLGFGELYPKALAGLVEKKDD